MINNKSQGSQNIKQQVDKFVLAFIKIMYKTVPTQVWIQNRRTVEQDYHHNLEFYKDVLLSNPSIVYTVKWEEEGAKLIKSTN